MSYNRAVAKTKALSRVQEAHQISRRLGSWFPPDLPAPHRCRHCGAVNNARAARCSSCGGAR